MKTLLNPLAAILAMLLSAPLASESLSPKYDSLFYYRIGGGRTFTSAPKLELTNLNLSLKGSITGLQCGKFDPKVTVSNTLNRVKDGVEDVYTQLESAAGAAIGALPGYILQSIDPGLYDLFMNSIFRAEEQFSMATKSCEKMSAEISQGKNPFDDMVTFSIGETWKGSAGVAGVDIVDVQKEAATDAAKNAGITWINNERAGGLGMDPVWLTSDTAKAGYNMLLNRTASDATAPTQNDDTPPIAKRFTSPDEIKSWLRVVVGDTFTGSCDSCAKGGLGGQGLRTLLEEEKVVAQEALQKLYDGTDSPDLANLEAASAPEIIITRQVIETIQGMDSNDASIFLSKLTDEIAMSRVINDALLIQQTLKTGKKEAHVQALPMATEEAEKVLAAIDEEIDSLVRESRIKKELVSQTVSEVLVFGRAMETLAVDAERLPLVDPRPLKNGAVEE
jgi:integrating conjugative element protein (TIGR03755 family)